MPRADGKPYHFELAPAKPLVKRAPGTRPKRAPVVAKVSKQLVPNKGGRPVSIKPTPALVAGVCVDVLGGLPIDSALVLQGMSRSNVPNWLKLHPAAAREFEQAESEWEKRLVGRVELHGLKDHKASTWLLERRAAQRWAPMTKTELSGKNGAPLQTMTLSKVLLATVASVGDTLERAKPVRAARPKHVDLESSIVS